MEFFAETAERLDKFLAARVKKFSRTEWQRFIKDGAVKVNGHVVIKPGFDLRAHDRLLILGEKIIGRKEGFRIEPEPDIPLAIVYEDADILVVDKPAGLLVHPTFTEHRHTLVNALVARYPDIVSVGENPLRPGIVHRLDKDTSGLIVVAKNQAAFLFVKEQFLKREIEKKYLALSEGIPKESEGTISYDIRPSTSNRLKKVAVIPRAQANLTQTTLTKPFDGFGKLTAGKIRARKSTRAAETHYAVKKMFGARFALLDVTPKTGRTHQIRVHLAAIGCPIVGDTLYGGKKETARKLGLKRQFLHAYYLKLATPSGKTIAFEVGLPEDLREALEKVASR